MKVGLVGDVHLGNHRAYGGALSVGLNDRAAYILEALESAKRQALAQGCERLVIAGDVFDSTTPLPQQLRALGDTLMGIDTVLLVGNHDRVSRLPGDHALAPLIGWSQLHVIDRPGTRGTWCYLPFDTEPPLRQLAMAIGGAGVFTGPRFVVGHFGLYDFPDAPPWMREARDAADAMQIGKFLHEHNVSHLFVGNYHSAARWRYEAPGYERVTHLIQLGALVPTGWDNPGLEGYGGLVVFDTDTLELQRFEVNGPRFLKVHGLHDTSRHFLADLPYSSGGCPRYVRWTVALEDVSAAEAIAADLLCEGPVYVEVLPDGKQIERAALSAANTARAQDTLASAAAGFVDQLALPEGIRREAVHDNTRRLLKL